MRGGAFKPRTSPYSFQGMGEDGLKILRAAADRYNLLIVSEVMDRSQIEMMLRYVDILQVGARNMQNFDLLKDLGKVQRPVLLKRGIAATLQELLLAAEYIMAGGNKQVILCERGIRTYETSTRNTLDISAIPVVKTMSHLPIVVDPSHSTGMRHLVAPVARAAIAAGADGLHHRGAQPAGEGAVRRRAVAPAGADHRAGDADPRHRRSRSAAAFSRRRRATSQRRQAERVPAERDDAEPARARVGRRAA